MQGGQDYTKKVFLFTLLVIGLLVCVAFIPSTRVGNKVLKRVNILSDVVTFLDENLIPLSDMSLQDTSYLEGMPSANKLLASQQNIDTNTHRRYAVPAIKDPSIVQITDYSPDQQMMAPFYHALAYEAGDRTVRVAVLGDSFIEGDIITADMREQLQLAYGGNGVGFVPFSTPFSKYRGTVTHNHKGWTNYNLIKRKRVPEEYKNCFFVSGMLSIPSEGSKTEYKGVQFRRHIEKSNSASIYFVNRKNSKLDITVNDTEKLTYAPPSCDSVQRIEINEPAISSLKVTVNNADGFIGYGVVMEDNTGVSVHSFSVRSNSGLALLGTNANINTQFDQYAGYDLIVLQYGLNAMSADVTNYTPYRQQMVRMINYIKQCFPRSAIVVMSVGDRSTMQNGTAVTMPAVKAMLRAQEEAAKECGVGFWNTYKAMGGDNSMPKFVERKWAAKDYTHLGYRGGKYIAEQFVRFITAAVESVREQGHGVDCRDMEPFRPEIMPRSTLPSVVPLSEDSYSDERRHMDASDAVAGARRRNRITEEETVDTIPAGGNYDKNRDVDTLNGEDHLQGDIPEGNNINDPETTITE